MQTRQAQTGFTLVEITIVLVIIGLLIGGVIKGQELINSGKVKNLSNDFKNIPLYIYGYQDKFKALPGDDAAAINNVAASHNGDGNGSIDGYWNDPTSANSEAARLWQVIRLANLATGSTNLNDSAYAPTNALGGRLGIQSGTSNVNTTPITDGAQTPTAIRGNYVICSANIPGSLAKQLDKNLDDGNPAAGSMMVGVATAVGTSMSASSTLSDNSNYTVCMGV